MIDKQGWLAVVTFVVLISLVVIQVLFIVKAGKLEEKHFNHRVVLALREARNEIAREANLCNNMHNYICGNQCSEDLQCLNFQKVDSIIQSNLYLHKINLDYRFEFVNEHEEKKGKVCISCYEQSLNGLLAQNGIKLVIEFPEQSKFLFAQLGTLFYLSIAAILFVMTSFFITYRLFNKKKAILLNTKDFIDNMVHEFQTPIANVRFASGLIKKKIGSGNESKIEEYAQLIHNENNKLAGHVQDILKVATMETVKEELEYVDIHALVRDCVSDIIPQVTEQGGTVAFYLDATNCMLKGEYTYLRHAIANLLDNAVKYTNGNAPQVTISTKNENKQLLVSIADNGIGISANEFSNIFQKYYRVSSGNVHDTKGFGLGLDFVKNVMDRHRGTVEVKSELNKGSVFTLKFNVK